MPAADTVMLSETTDGDYLVRRFIVKRPGDTDYSVRYQINLAKLSSTLDGNSRELGDLDDFVGNLMKDTLMRVNAVAEDWEMCRALVAKSEVPDKQSVLDILDGSRSPDAKELALKKMPSAWNYMKKNILPPLRRVELTINYGEGSVVEQRTMIPRPKPAPQPVCEPCGCEVIDESITGIIVEMPGSDVDYKKELREARKIVREQERAARKTVREEAKAAKKSYKELEKM